MREAFEILAAIGPYCFVIWFIGCIAYVAYTIPEYLTETSTRAVSYQQHLKTGWGAIVILFFLEALTIALWPWMAIHELGLRYESKFLRKEPRVGDTEKKSFDMNGVHFEVRGGKVVETTKQ